jgi:hypothetical protein
MLLFISKKRHIEAVLNLQSEISRLEGLYTMADRDAREWRAKFELSQLTPEVKADIESAFTRGEHNAKTKISAVLMQLAMELRNGTDA